jgi:hypothetical protein
VSRRRVPEDELDVREPEAPEAAPEPPEEASILALQRGAGNAAVSRMVAQRRLARWSDLGTESWHIRGLGGRSMTVWTGSKQEWLSRLDNIDDEDEYREDLWGFLTASNDPGIVGRTQPPRHIANNPEDVNYQNTIQRVPTDAEKLAFLEALYEKAGDLDLWHGGALEGGPWLHWADAELGQFLRENQGLYLLARSRAGQRVSAAGVQAVAEQGGRAATMAMILNAGATAHKGVDLVMTAKANNNQSEHAAAMELIRNSKRTIKAALAAHDARVAFQKEVVGLIFDTVWGAIPGGGTLVDAGKDLLKFGLDKALEEASKDDGPAEQVETITDEFVATVNRLINQQLLPSPDGQDAILSFEAI